MIAGFQRFRKVEEAVSSKDEPVPVYLLEELASMSRTSPEDAQHIADHLVRKLESKSPITKAKALKSMKYICGKGCLDFQRALQRQAGCVRPLRHYHGQMDPLKGDALNEKVRTAAKETVEAIFEATVRPTSTIQSSGPTAIQSHSRGFGPSSMSNGGHAPSTTSSSKMVGFGSDQFRAPSHQPAERFLPGGGFRPAPPARSASSNRSKPWQQSSLLESGQAEPDPSPALGRGSENGSFTRAAAKVRPESVLGDEQEVVERVCEPGGVRLQPAKDDLKRFIDTVGSLDGTKVGVALQAKMESGTWQECFKALCALEGVLQHGSSISCGEIGVHFQCNLGPLEAAKASVQGSVRERAHRVLVLLGIEEDTPKQRAEGRAATRTREVSLIGDLLGGEGAGQAQPPGDLLGELSDPLSQPTGAVAAPPANNDLGSLLDMGDPAPIPATGMPQPQAQVPQPAPAMQPMPVPAAASTPSVAEVNGLFEGLQMDSAAPATNVTRSPSNPILAALMAPSPPSDPFPEATPLQPEHASVGQAGQAAAPPGLAPYTGHMMPGMPGMMQGMVAPGPMMNMGGVMVPPGAQLGAVQMQAGGGMPQMMVPQMVPGMVMPQAAVPQMGWLPGAQAGMATGLGGVPSAVPSLNGDRAEVPLNSFMGPGHVSHATPGGKQNAAFSFIGDHVSSLRKK